MPQTADPSSQFSAPAQISKESATPAHLGLRLIAAVYDLLPLLALWFVAAVIALLVTGGALDVRRFADKMLIQGCVLALTALYFIASWLRGGQTVGMRAWRLRVVAADGAPVGARRALLRFATALVALAAGGLGFLWCLIDSERRGWHDIAAGTLLVRMDKEQG
ncbi:MAG: RDD family protein [Rudaea sp.]